MTKWKLKNCPRCGGDIFIEKNSDQWCEHCLQCGYLRSIVNMAETRCNSIHQEWEGEAELQKLHPF